MLKWKRSRVSLPQTEAPDPSSFEVGDRFLRRTSEPRPTVKSYTSLLRSPPRTNDLLARTSNQLAQADSPPQTSSPSRTSSRLAGSRSSNFISRDNSPSRNGNFSTRSNSVCNVNRRGSSPPSPKTKPRPAERFIQMVRKHLFSSNTKPSRPSRQSRRSSSVSPVLPSGGRLQSDERRGSLMFEKMPEESHAINMKNFSAHLRIEGISKGQMSASFPLADIPNGTLSLRVRNNQLVFVSQAEARGDIAAPVPIGYLELPVFLEPSSLKCEKEGHGLLRLRASTKASATGRRQSLPVVTRISREPLPDKIKTVMKRSSVNEKGSVVSWQFKITH